MTVVTRMTHDDFDSILQLPPGPEPANCILTLRLLVFLEKVDARVYQKRGRVFRTRPWPPTEWNHFVSRYQQIAQHFWSKRFWLIPADGYAGLDLPPGGPMYRPNIRCTLQLEPVLNPRAARHTRIRVVCLEEDEQRFFRSSYRLSNGQGADGPPSEDDPLQLPVAFEVGQLLGLPFSLPSGAAEDASETRADRCHGRAGFKWDEMLNPRTILQEEHALPWCRRIAEHTQTDPENWRVVRSEVPPRLLADLPAQSLR